MPGLRYLGPTLTSTHHGSQPLFQQDVYMPIVPDFKWDLNVDLNLVQLPVVDEFPLVPNKHKACCPPQLHSAWLKSKGKTRACITSSYFPPHQCNGSINDTEDLAAMVHDFIESGSLDFLDGNDGDGGPPSIAKLCETLQVVCNPPRWLTKFREQSCSIALDLQPTIVNFVLCHIFTRNYTRFYEPTLRGRTFNNKNQASCPSRFLTSFPSWASSAYLLKLAFLAD